MPNFTANFALPYPNGSDDPCEFATDWCAFTDAVNAVLDGFQATIDRTVPVIPAAQLRATVSRAYNAPVTGNIIFFDTVSFDTAGWIDFDADQQTISIDRAGLFATSGNDTQSPDGVNSVWNISIIGAGGNGNNILDRGVAGQTIGNWTVKDTGNSSSTDIQLEVSGPQNTFTIQTAYLTAYWHSDTSRPS